MWIGHLSQDQAPSPPLLPLLLLPALPRLLSLLDIMLPPVTHVKAPTVLLTGCFSSHCFLMHRCVTISLPAVLLPPVMRCVVLLPPVEQP